MHGRAHAQIDSDRDAVPHGRRGAHTRRDNQDQFRTLVTFAAYTGLRAGEIGALRVGRVDLKRGSVEVRESLADVKGKLVFGSTKTYAHRTVRLPAFLTPS